MMAVAYIFALVVGGGFMALSLLGDVAGGGDVADVDLDLDLDLDADLDVDAGGGSDVNALKILSLRTLVYALFGFGAVGTILTQMWGGAQASQTALFATAGGVATGFIASALFGFLRRSEVGDRAGEASFVPELPHPGTAPRHGRTPGPGGVEGSAGGGDGRGDRPCSPGGRGAPAPGRRLTRPESGGPTPAPEPSVIDR
jgi:hypothetical protein